MKDELERERLRLFIEIATSDSDDVTLVRYYDVCKQLQRMKDDEAVAPEPAA